MSESELERLKRVAKEAEGAVQSVSDAELRRVAYDKVLTQLMQASTSKSHSHSKQSTLLSPTTKNRLTRSGPMQWLSELVSEGFFVEAKTAPVILARLKESGHHLEQSAISRQLQSLTRGKVLRRVPFKEGGGSRAAWVIW
nr:hypothetical protein [Ferrimicrobium acidiphilum]